MVPHYARGMLLRAHHVGGSWQLKVGRGVRVGGLRRDTQVLLGERVRLHRGVAFMLDAPGARVEIGPRTYLNRRTEVMCRERVTIGADCAISWDVSITDTDYHSIDGQPDTAAVTIGDHVWVGARATVLKGVEIGAGAVVAAGSVVVSDVPAGCLVAGVPARVVREGVTWR